MSLKSRQKYFGNKTMLAGIFILSVIAISTAHAGSCDVVRDGLVACYPFNGNADDESGHGYNGTVNGATLTTDRFGNIDKAYSFNGSTSISVSTPWKEPYTAEITHSFWFNPSMNLDSSTPRQNILAAQTTQSYYIGSSQGGWDNKSGLVFEIWGNFFPPKFYSVPMDFVQGTWHHVVIEAKEFEFARIIIDGITHELDAPNFTFSTQDPEASGSVRIGMEWNACYFNGKIDDIRIYDRAISEAEIQQLYNYSSGFTITASAGIDGTISPSGSVSVSSGQSKTFSVTPAACYDVDKILVNGSAVTLTDGQYTFPSVTADQTISATFKQNPCCTYSVQTQIDTAKQAAIQSCKDNPASCGLLSQAQSDQAVSAATASMYTKAQLDAARQSGIDLVKANPGDYQLLTQAQSDQAVSAATASMYTKTQMDDAVKTEQLKWDANGDGKIGLEDIIYMLQVIAGLRP